MVSSQPIVLLTIINPLISITYSIILFYFYEYYTYVQRALRKLTLLLLHYLPLFCLKAMEEHYPCHGGTSKKWDIWRQILALTLISYVILQEILGNGTSVEGDWINWVFTVHLRPLVSDIHSRLGWTACRSELLFMVQQCLRVPYVGRHLWHNRYNIIAYYFKIFW